MGGQQTQFTIAQQTVLAEVQFVEVRGQGGITKEAVFELSLVG